MHCLPLPCSFQRFIVAQYRAGAPVTDRSEAKRLRLYAEDVLSYFSALAAQSVRARASGLHSV